MSSSEFSLADGTLTGWVKPAEAPPLTESVPATTEEPASEGGMLTMNAVARASEPTVTIAFSWAKIYANDFEYKPFFDWINARSNPERTDFVQILESIPMRWRPEDLPPPLRRWFLRKFGG